jgi:hypothetical protein
VGKFVDMKWNEVLLTAAFFKSMVVRGLKSAAFPLFAEFVLFTRVEV